MIARVSAQTVAPQNTTNNSSITAPFVLYTQLQGMKTSPNINPLTDLAGLKGSPSQLEVDILIPQENKTCAYTSHSKSLFKDL